MHWEPIPLLRLLILLLLPITLSAAVDPTQFCENYSICLSRLEDKQRECSKFPEIEGNGKESNLTDCSRKKRREVHRDMAQLHLRRTEIVRDCVAKNVNRGEAILNQNKVCNYRNSISNTTETIIQEKKCLATAEKLSTFAEIIQTTTKSPRRKQKSTSSPDSKSPKRHSKRKEMTKQNSKLCRRTKKTLNRKCHQLAKCCSISKECDLLTDTIDEQLNGLKRELKSPTCPSK